MVIKTSTIYRILVLALLCSFLSLADAQAAGQSYLIEAVEAPLRELVAPKLPPSLFGKISSITTQTIYPGAVNSAWLTILGSTGTLERKIPFAEGNFKILNLGIHPNRAKKGSLNEYQGNVKRGIESALPLVPRQVALDYYIIMQIMIGDIPGLYSNVPGSIYDPLVPIELSALSINLLEKISRPDAFNSPQLKTLVAELNTTLGSESGRNFGQFITRVGDTFRFHVQQYVGRNGGMENKTAMILQTTQTLGTYFARYNPSYAASIKTDPMIWLQAQSTSDAFVAPVLPDVISSTISVADATAAAAPSETAPSTPQFSPEAVIDETVRKVQIGVVNPDEMFTSLEGPQLRETRRALRHFLRQADEISKKMIEFERTPSEVNQEQISKLQARLEIIKTEFDKTIGLEGAWDRINHAIQLNQANRKITTSTAVSQPIVFTKVRQFMYMILSELKTTPLDFDKLFFSIPDADKRASLRNAFKDWLSISEQLSRTRALGQGEIPSIERKLKQAESHLKRMIGLSQNTDLQTVFEDIKMAADIMIRIFAEDFVHGNISSSESMLESIQIHILNIFRLDGIAFNSDVSFQSSHGEEPRKGIQIIPAKDLTFLNTIAYELHKKYGAWLVFFPDNKHLLDALTFMSPTGEFGIQITPSIVLDRNFGIPGSSLAHEMRHVQRIAKSREKREDLYHGSLDLAKNRLSDYPFPGHMQKDVLTPYITTGLPFDELPALAAGLNAGAELISKLNAMVARLNSAKKANQSGFSLDQQSQLQMFDYQMHLAMDSFENEIYLGELLSRYIYHAMREFSTGNYSTTIKFPKPDERNLANTNPKVIFHISIDGKGYEISFPILKPEHLDLIRDLSHTDPVPDEILVYLNKRSYLYEIALGLNDRFKEIRQLYGSGRFDEVLTKAKEINKFAQDPPFDIPRDFLDTYLD